MIGILVTTLCVVMPSGRSASAWDAERPDGIPPERVPIGRGTSMFYRDLFYKTVVQATYGYKYG
jgi:hypothetical protein